MRRWYLTPLCLAIGCQAVPDDHLLRERTGQSLRRLQGALDPRPLLSAETRRLGEATAAIGSLDLAGPRGLTRARQTASEVWAEERRRPRLALASASARAEEELRSARRLWRQGSALRQLTSPSLAAPRIKRAAATAPAILGMETQPLPSDTDLNRQTGTEPAPRRETWLERIVRRLTF